jgi:hypothetical protein
LKTYNNPAADSAPPPNTVSTPLICPRDYIVGYETHARILYNTYTYLCIYMNIIIYRRIKRVVVFEEYIEKETLVSQPSPAHPSNPIPYRTPARPLIIYNNNMCWRARHTVKTRLPSYTACYYYRSLLPSRFMCICAADDDCCSIRIGLYIHNVYVCVCVLYSAPARLALSSRA